MPSNDCDPLFKARKMWYCIFSYLTQQEDILQDYGFQTVMNVSFSLNLTSIYSDMISYLMCFCLSQTKLYKQNLLLFPTHFNSGMAVSKS